MPPWAQTECERLTGTMEKRSTLPPASAILMTAARPARPPPTTMILGVAAAMSYSLSGGILCGNRFLPIVVGGLQISDEPLDAFFRIGPQSLRSQIDER